MTDEPEIVKELRESEKLGRLQSMIQSTIEELKVPDESIEKISDQTNHMVEDWEKGTNKHELWDIEEKYRTIFENYAIGITLADNKERIVSWNKYTEELLNKTKSELYLKSVSSLYPPEEWKKIRAENIRQKGIEYRMETRMIRKNQGCLDAELTLCVLKGKEGKTVGSVGIIKDITRLKKTEGELKKSEEKYRTIFENSAVGITLTDENERIISWNKSTEDILGSGKDDLFMKPVESLYPSEEWKKIRSENIRQKGLQYHMETKMFKKDNEIIDVDLSLSVLKNHEGKVYGSIGVFNDTTDRKRIEQELKIKERAIDSSINAVAISDLNGNLKYVNPSFLKMWRYANDSEILGKNMAEFWWEEERASEILQQLLEKGGCVNELTAKRNDGSLFDVQLSASLVKNEAGQPICKMASFLDITEHKQAEGELKKKLYELERYKKITVDRELKMVELKKRIEELERKLTRNHKDCS